MHIARLNAVSTALPDTEVHEIFKDFARRQITDRRRVLLERMMSRSGIERRYSVLRPTPFNEGLDDENFYRYGAFPSTAARMAIFDREAAPLAEKAVLGLGEDLSSVTHLIVTTCTGLTAPGIDLQLTQRLGLDPGVERTLIGFMGCYAAINALRLASQIVRAEPEARVLIVSVELCTLHLQETDDIETVLSFSIFGDGAAAALVSAERRGLRLDGFKTATMPDDQELITWRVGDQGFDMVLSGKVPGALKRGLPAAAGAIAPEGIDAFPLLAIHPGGASILDAVESALGVPAERLSASRKVLREAGNMSSPSVLFVLAEILKEGWAEDGAPETPGLAMAFGPGLTAETMRFSAAG